LIERPGIELLEAGFAVHEPFVAEHNDVRRVGLLELHKAVAIVGDQRAVGAGEQQHIPGKRGVFDQAQAVKAVQATVEQVEADDPALQAIDAKAGEVAVEIGGQLEAGRYGDVVDALHAFGVAVDGADVVGNGVHEDRQKANNTDEAGWLVAACDGVGQLDADPEHKEDDEAIAVMQISLALKEVRQRTERRSDKQSPLRKTYALFAQRGRDDAA